MAGGQQITSGQGTLSPPRHGVSSTAAAGSVALVVTLALVGSAIASGQGLATASNNGTVALIGSASSVQQQTIAPSWGQALTGSETALSRGSVLPVINPSTSGGQVITPAAGTLVAAGSSPVTVNITGSESTFGAGFVASGGTLITGVAVAGQQGAYGLGWAVPLAGSEFAGALGTVATGQDADDTAITSGQGSAGPAVAAALSGLASTGAQGSVGITSDASMALVGEQATAAAGSVGFSQAFALTGVASTGAQYNVGAPGGASLSGAQSLAVAGDLFLTGDRTFAISGQAVTAQRGVCFASSLAFPPGQSLTITQQTMGPKAAALSGRVVTVSQGTLLAEGGDRAASTGAADYAGNSGKLKKRKFLRQIAGQVVEFPTAEAALSAYDPTATKATKPVVQEVIEPEAAEVPAETEDEEALLEMLVML